MKISVKQFFLKGGFNKKIVYFDPCHGIVIVRNFQKYLFILTFELISGRNYKFNFFRQGINRETYTSGGSLDAQKISRVLGRSSGCLMVSKCALNNDSSRS